MLQIFSKEKVGENKKIIENLVLFLVLFIIVIIVMNVLTNESSEQDIGTLTNPVNTIIQTDKEESLEEKLESILSFIQGAGKVEVLITYENGVEQIPMYDSKQSTTITEEMDKAGGTRKTEEISQEQNVIFEEVGNEKVPVIKQMINPEIVGVIVVAEGAESLTVKENLMKAVESSLNVPSHRIQVFARKK